MSFAGVMRPGHAAIRVLDMEESLTYYTERLGLMKPMRTTRAGFISRRGMNWTVFHIVLREAPSPGIDYTGYKNLSAGRPG